MAEIIQFRAGSRKMNEKVPVHQQIDSLDDSTAFLIGQSIQDVKRVNDPTRLKIARNLAHLVARTQMDESA